MNFLLPQEVWEQQNNILYRRTTRLAENKPDLKSFMVGNELGPCGGRHTPKRGGGRSPPLSPEPPAFEGSSLGFRRRAAGRACRVPGHKSPGTAAPAARLRWRRRGPWPARAPAVIRALCILGAPFPSRSTPKPPPRQPRKRGAASRGSSRPLGGTGRAPFPPGAVALRLRGERRRPGRALPAPHPPQRRLRSLCESAAPKASRLPQTEFSDRFALGLGGRVRFSPPSRATQFDLIPPSQRSVLNCLLELISPCSVSPSPFWSTLMSTAVLLLSHLSDPRLRCEALEDSGHIFAALKQIL
ncbi:uncharacterized protein LOC122468571 [Prionailurus bengalensis]|uniref:uncharacterized protein LOC122468571 n=1 Tax=Prionailurus bengalensis TaxID=37029 RepID=UPI001CA9E983|nr:uncharacterized protein LOC122468571 [Prionailurus bengalensis]